MSEILVELEEVLVIGGCADGQRFVVAKGIEILFCMGQEYRRKRLACDHSFCSIFVPSSEINVSVKEIIHRLIQCYSAKVKDEVMEIEMTQAGKQLTISKTE